MNVSMFTPCFPEDGFLVTPPPPAAFNPHDCEHTLSRSRVSRVRRSSLLVKKNSTNESP
jgi:hypothetical protein